MAKTEYFAEVRSGKDGRLLHKTEGYPTREEAARAAFEARPSAQVCITFRGYGLDIRTHRRDEV